MSMCFFLLQILKAPCLILSLFTSLNLCSGKFGTPITDDVSKLTLLVRLSCKWSCLLRMCRHEILCGSSTFVSPSPQKQNIPSDYEIPVSYIPKELVGMKAEGMSKRVFTLCYVKRRMLFPGRHVLGGVKYLPFGAKPSEAGKHVWYHLLQQGQRHCLHRNAEKFTLHIWPWGTGEWSRLALRRRWSMKWDDLVWSCRKQRCSSSSVTTGRRA